MGFARLIFAIAIILIGAIFTMTIIGAIIGIPMILLGMYLVYKTQRGIARETITEGVKKALEEERKEREGKSEKG